MASQEEARKDYYRARIQNLREQVPMVSILESLGVNTRMVEGHEVQYPCPLHGDGKDQGYSARVYPDGPSQPGGSTFCWGCQKVRDQVEWVRDYHSMSFMAAVKYIEEEWDVKHIPPIHAYFDPNFVEEGEDESKFQKEINTILHQEKIAAKDSYIPLLLRRLSRLVQTKRENISRDTILTLYFIIDQISYDTRQGFMNDEKALAMAQKVSTKIQNLSENDHGT